MTPRTEALKRRTRRVLGEIGWVLSLGIYSYGAASSISADGVRWPFFGWLALGFAIQWWSMEAVRGAKWRIVLRGIVTVIGCVPGVATRCCTPMIR